MGEVFWKRQTRYSMFLSLRSLKILWGWVYLNSTMKKWTGLDFHWVYRIYLKYTTPKCEFKGTRILSTRLDIFRSSAHSILDPTRFDFCWWLHLTPRPNLFRRRRKLSGRNLFPDTTSTNLLTSTFKSHKITFRWKKSFRVWWKFRRHLLLLLLLINY